jgi:SAM-dependent methyltransferase
VISNSYRENTFEHLRRELAAAAPLGRVLDFGSGDGWFAGEVMRHGLAQEVVCVDVMRRDHTVVEPILYDGDRLPFADRTFDLVYAVDVMHHVPRPPAALEDALRCARRSFVLKDHNYLAKPNKIVLAVLDEIGNRRFGVPTVHTYQRRWEWLPVIEAQGFTQRSLRHPISCETRPVLSWFVNEFQFIGRWDRA